MNAEHERLAHSIMEFTREAMSTYWRMSGYGPNREAFIQSLVAADLARSGYQIMIEPTGKGVRGWLEIEEGPRSKIDMVVSCGTSPGDSEEIAIVEFKAVHKPQSIRSDMTRTVAMLEAVQRKHGGRDIAAMACVALHRLVKIGIDPSEAERLRDHDVQALSDYGKSGVSVMHHCFRL